MLHLAASHTKLTTKGSLQNSEGWRGRWDLTMLLLKASLFFCIAKDISFEFWQAAGKE